MARNFRPFLTIITEESSRKYSQDHSGKIKSAYVTIEYPTYRELKRNIGRHILENLEADYVSVTRHRRGEWGEWFEHWTFLNGKATIIKEGWC